MEKPNYQTSIRRWKDGWHGETWAQLAAPLDNKVMSFATRKSSDGSLTTTIACLEHTGIEGMLRIPLYGGFVKHIVTHPKRVTEKLVREQHERALSMLDAITQEAVEFFLVPKAKAA